MNEKFTGTDRVVFRSLKNGIKMVTGQSNKAVYGDGESKTLTYEKDRSQFMLVLQSDIAGRDTRWTTDSGFTEFEEYVESVKKRMVDEE
ncbi:hypothetical protein MNBD_NITROSPINAE04-1747 [hydrothermal vent metagenome]|uniref:Uncharacterized protein n=1 Tax=hydrothermal vent metagenome TaxID=652676 RepID=A0A3B1CU48_9ZZZZ